MAVRFGFYNSINKDRSYDALDMSSIFDGIIEDGVFATIDNAFKVSPGEGLQVIVDTGKAWFNHTWTVNDAPYPLAIDAPDITLDRYDAVVLEVNSENSVRANSLKVVKGAASSSPQKPALANSETVHQHPLAYVKVGHGVTSIQAKDIEITVGRGECPFVRGPLEVISIDEIYAKWEQEFSDWFDNIQSQMAGDVATNLQNQIDTMKNPDSPGSLQNQINNLPRSVHPVGTIITSLRSDLDSSWVLCNGEEAIEAEIGSELYKLLNPGYVYHFEEKAAPIQASSIQTISNTSGAFGYGNGYFVIACTSGNILYGTSMKETLKVRGLSSSPLLWVRYDEKWGRWIALTELSSKQHRLVISDTSDPGGGWQDTAAIAGSISFYSAVKAGNYILLFGTGNQGFYISTGGIHGDSWKRIPDFSASGDAVASAVHDNGDGSFVIFVTASTSKYAYVRALKYTDPGVKGTTLFTKHVFEDPLSSFSESTFNKIGNYYIAFDSNSTGVLIGDATNPNAETSWQYVELPGYGGANAGFASGKLVILGRNAYLEFSTVEELVANAGNPILMTRGGDFTTIMRRGLVFDGHGIYGIAGLSTSAYQYVFAPERVLPVPIADNAYTYIRKG